MIRLVSFKETCQAPTRICYFRQPLRLRRDASLKPWSSSCVAPSTRRHLKSSAHISKARPYSEPQSESRRTIRDRFNTLVSHLTWANAVSFGQILAFFSILANFMVHFVAWQHAVAGPSMLPTLASRGDWVLISYLHPRLLNIQRGDLVSFESPIHPGARAIKRVIGMPGDLVLRDTPPGSSDNFWMEADPARWEAEGKTKQHGPGWMVRVPEGHCWVVGDNLSWSRDSRHFGPLPLALVKGRVLARISPKTDRQWFWRSSVYEDVD